MEFAVKRTSDVSSQGCQRLVPPLTESEGQLPNPPQGPEGSRLPPGVRLQDCGARTPHRAQQEAAQTLSEQPGVPVSREEEITWGNRNLEQ